MSTQQHSPELETKRLEMQSKVASLIARKEKKIAETTKEIEQLTGERKVALQTRTDQQKEVDELYGELRDLSLGKFPERLFPHASSDIQDTADEDEATADADKPARRQAKREETEKRAAGRSGAATLAV